MKGLYALSEKFDKVGRENIFVSEITVAELKFGVENSQNKGKNRRALEKFLLGVNIIPIFQALDIYAVEKSRPRKQGTPVDDFDLLIGATAVNFDMVMVTNNLSHFERLDNIVIEDWTK